MVKLPAKYATVLMPLFLSILMTCIVSLVSTLKSVGLHDPQLLVKWLMAWLISWFIAFPTLLIALPFVRKLTAFCVE